MRNTPILVQMYLFYFGLAIYGIRLSGFAAGLLALVLQNGGYVAEIYRAGIAGVDRGQREAGLSLGLRPSRTFQLVILPQAIRLVIAPLGNQFLVIMKDTALVSTLSVADMTFQARLLIDRTAAAYEIFLTLALLYLVLNGLLAGLMRTVEWYSGRPADNANGPGTQPDLAPVRCFVTLALSAGCVAAASAIGLVVALGGLFGGWPVRLLTLAYLCLMPGMPLLILIIGVYYVYPMPALNWARSVAE